MRGNTFITATVCAQAYELEAVQRLPSVIEKHNAGAVFMRGIGIDAQRKRYDRSLHGKGIER